MKETRYEREAREAEEIKIARLKSKLEEEKATQTWLSKIQHDKQAPLSEKIKKSIFIAEKLIFSIGEKLTDKMRQEITTETEKFFLENPNKAYYDQKWFIKYLKTSPKKMSMLGESYANAIIKSLFNANNI